MAETLIATDRVKPRCDSSAIEGEVVWAPAKSLWYSSMLVAGLIGGALYCTWAAIAVFLFLSVVAELGLNDHLTPQRSNGLVSMVARIKSNAQSEASRDLLPVSH